MRGLVIHPTYRTEKEKTDVYLMGRLENGESFLIANTFKPYFYIKQTDVKNFTSQPCETPYEIEESEFVSFEGEHLSKVIITHPRQVNEIKRAISGIPFFEADIRYAYRYMIDTGILGVVHIPDDAPFEKGSTVDRIYTNVDVSGDDSTAPAIKVLSFDIETDRKGQNVFSISLVTDSESLCLVQTNTTLQGYESYATEKELLIAFREKIIEIDPDIITGWNCIDFDLKVLQDRFRAHNIPFKLGRVDFDTRITSFDSFFRDSQAMIAGRMVLDGIHLLKNNFIKLEDYRLQTAASEVLGESKLIEGDDRCAEIERMWKEDPQSLADYNVKDSELVLRILEKLNLINLTIGRSVLTGMQPDRVSASIASLDNLYLRETRKRKVACYSVVAADREERIKGGYVRDPETGIFDYVIVLDFKSLYPSIIRTFNIDPLSHKADGEVEAPNGACFLRSPEGILPSLIQRLWKGRDLAKKNKDDVASYAIKITMNSFFGVLANPMCRFYSLDVANAITAFGRKIIQDTAEMLECEGYKVIYGDTDSIFIDVRAKSIEEAEKVGNSIQEEINAHYKDSIERDYGRKNCLELEFEKTFVRFLIPNVRGGEGGAKKRYAGLVVKDGKEEIKFTGMEFVRRDWTDLAKNFQKELFDRIFHKREVLEYVKSVLKDLKAGKMDSDLVYKKAIRKPLEEYIKTTPPHVKAARIIVGREGKLTSKLIKYYVTKNGPEPVDYTTGDIDYDHYIEKQLKPIADSVLVFFGQSFDDLVKGSSQKTLFGF